MNNELIRIVPKPSEKPAYVESIFSCELTPEKVKPTLAISRRPKAKVLIQKKANSAVIEHHDSNKIIPRPGCLVQPAINSTVRLGQKLQELQDMNFNPSEATAEELKNSETTRISLAEKVSNAVNVKRDHKMYTDLMPLDVVPDDVIPYRLQPRAPSAKKCPKTQENKPHIMDFFSDNFEDGNAKFEFDLLDEDNAIPSINFEHEFDLYSRMECWHYRWK